MPTFFSYSGNYLIGSEGGNRTFAASANSDQLSAEADLRRLISAVRVGDGSAMMRKCCDQSNGGREPVATNFELVGF